MRARTHARPADLVELTDAAMAIGLAIVLGNLKLVELPAGGSVSAGIVPLIALAVVRGPRVAFVAGWCTGLAHALLGGVIVHPAQLLLDYGLAYAGLAVAGLPLVRGRAIGIILASAVQLACFSLSGVLFFAASVTHAAWAFSISYNAATVIPECVIALVLVPIVVRAYRRVDPSLDVGGHAGLHTVAPGARIAAAERSTVSVPIAGSIPAPPCSSTSRAQVNRVETPAVSAGLTPTSTAAVAFPVLTARPRLDRRSEPIGPGSGRLSG